MIGLEDLWKEILNATSKRHTATVESVGLGQDGTFQVEQPPSLGGLPPGGLPPKTRFGWAKRILLRIMRVYTRDQQAANYWLYQRIDEQRSANWRNALKLYEMVQDVRNRNDQREHVLQTISEQLDNNKRLLLEWEDRLQDSQSSLELELEKASIKYQQFNKEALQMKELFQSHVQDQDIHLHEASEFYSKAIDSSRSLETRVIGFEDSLQLLNQRLSALVERVEDSEQKNDSVDQTAQSAFFEGINSTLRHDGIFGKHNLWFNNPLVLELKNGIPEIGEVNERIFESALALSRVGGNCSVDSQVLDVGSSESILPLQLASTGYKVTALDFRSPPYTHPNLTWITGDFLSVNLPKGGYSFITCVSVLEHFGLGWYGDPLMEREADLYALKKMYSLLSEGGSLFITTPVARVFTVNEVERTYTMPILEELTQSAGFQTIERDVYAHVDKKTWLRLSKANELGGTRGVAVVLLRKGEANESIV